MKKYPYALFIQMLSVMLLVLHGRSTKANKDKFVRFCYCDANEVRVNDSCVRNATFVEVFEDFSRYTTKIVPTSDFRVDTRKISCLGDRQVLKLPHFYFVLHDSGELFDYILYKTHPHSHYCLDYYASEEGELKAEALICVSVPKVPLCCNENQIFKELSGECDALSAFDSHFPVYYGTSSEHFPLDYVSLPDKNVMTCGRDERMTFADLNYGTDFLFVNEMNQLMLHYSGEEGDILVSHSEFCVGFTKASEKMIYSVAKFCYGDCARQECIGKCCRQGEGFLEGYCKPIEMQNLTFINDVSLLKDAKYKTIPKMSPLCADGQFLAPVSYLEDKLSIINGSLVVNSPSGERSYARQDFCVEYKMHKNKSVSEIALACTSEATKKCSWRVILYPVLMGVSCFFLLITFLVFVCIRKLRTKLHSLCLASEVLSLFVVNILLAILYTNESFFVGCRIVGVLTHYFVLASFFWLNVMCFDLWSAFSRTWHVAEDCFRKVIRHFLKYCIYGWGVPLFIVIVGIIMDEVDENNPRAVVATGIKASCYISQGDTAAKWLYVYGIMLLLLTINTVFFVLLSYTLIKSQKESKKTLGTQDRQPKTERFKLYLKLFVIMGLSWLLDIISYSFISDCNYWLLTDIINLLRGVLIFLIFVCKRNIWTQVRETKLFRWLHLKTTPPERLELNTRLSNLSATQAYSTKKTLTTTFSGTERDGEKK